MNRIVCSSEMSAHAAKLVVGLNRISPDADILVEEIPSYRGVFFFRVAIKSDGNSDLFFIFSVEDIDSIAFEMKLNEALRDARWGIEEKPIDMIYGKPVFYITDYETDWEWWKRQWGKNK